MFFSTVIEIIASIFIVYGLYSSLKSMLFLVVYERKIRKSVSVAVRIYTDDSEEDIRLKLMCANQIARDITPGKKVHIIKDKE